MESIHGHPPSSPGGVDPSLGGVEACRKGRCFLVQTVVLRESDCVSTTQRTTKDLKGFKPSGGLHGMWLVLVALRKGCPGLAVGIREELPKYHCPPCRGPYLASQSQPLVGGFALENVASGEAFRLLCCPPFWPGVRSQSSQPPPPSSLLAYQPFFLGHSPTSRLAVASLGSSLAVPCLFWQHLCSCHSPPTPPLLPLESHLWSCRRSGSRSRLPPSLWPRIF